MTEPNSEALRITENLHSLQGEVKTVEKPTAFFALTGYPLSVFSGDSDWW
jgi:hypothetical protein